MQIIFYVWYIFNFIKFPKWLSIASEFCRRIRNLNFDSFFLTWSSEVESLNGQGKKMSENLWNVSQNRTVVHREKY
jgi:hypothetical protein